MRRVTLVLILVLALSGVAGCSSQPSSSPSRPPATAGLFGEKGPKAPVQPSGPNLADPVSAVHAYTDWISYAYIVGKSVVATHAFSLYEEVRVDSYIMLNLSENKQTIDQHLVDSSYRLVSKETTKAIVAGSEDWRYRYVNFPEGTYKSPVHSASYDVTYTVIYEERDRKARWVVDHVDAKARGEVQ